MGSEMCIRDRSADTLSEDDHEKVMLFVLNKLSARFNQLAALQYGVAPPVAAARMRHK